MKLITKDLKIVGLDVGVRVVVNEKELTRYLRLNKGKPKYVKGFGRAFILGEAEGTTYLHPADETFDLVNVIAIATQLVEILGLVQRIVLLIKGMFK
jgi:hypothetical protein